MTVGWAADPPQLADARAAAERYREEVRGLQEAMHTTKQELDRETARAAAAEEARAEVPLPPPSSRIPRPFLPGGIAPDN